MENLEGKKMANKTKERQLKAILDCCNKIDLQRSMDGAVTYVCEGYNPKLQRQFKVCYTFYRCLDEDYNFLLLREAKGWYMSETSKKHLEELKFVVGQKYKIHQRFCELWDK